MQTFIETGHIVETWEKTIIKLARKYSDKYKTLKYQSKIISNKYPVEGVAYRYFVTNKEMDKDA